MLVLSRKNGETINIGHDIEVRVLAIKGNTVKLGFTAPSQVNILRKELAPPAQLCKKILELKTSPSVPISATFVSC